MNSCLFENKTTLPYSYLLYLLCKKKRYKQVDFLATFYCCYIRMILCQDTDTKHSFSDYICMLSISWTNCVYMKYNEWL